jgi:hypothetical protein
MSNEFHYPPLPKESGVNYFGLHPVDFILETVLSAGMSLFQTDDDFARAAFSQLDRPYLQAQYGEKKIDEIIEFIRSNEVRVIQGFPMSDEQSPTISLNLSDGAEAEKWSGLDDFMANQDALDMQGNVLGRDEIGYVSMEDSVLVGIHAIGGPDKVKYLYYLVAYIIVSFRDQLEERELILSTFRATDLSRLNEYLPENMFSRFITFKATSIAPVKKGSVPIIDELILNVNTDC